MHSREMVAFYGLAFSLAQPSLPSLKSQLVCDNVPSLHTLALMLDYEKKKTHKKTQQHNNNKKMKANSHHCADHKHAWRGEFQECPRHSNQCLSTS